MFQEKHRVLSLHLEYDKNYTYKLMAIDPKNTNVWDTNANSSPNNSSWGTLKSIYTGTDTPQQVKGHVSGNVTWSPIEGAVSYIVNANGKHVPVSADKQTYTYTNLPENTLHDFNVAAVYSDSNGKIKRGPWSDDIPRSAWLKTGTKTTIEALAVNFRKSGTTATIPLSIKLLGNSSGYLLNYIEVKNA